MSTTTVAQFATELKMPVSELISQLVKAGVGVTYGAEKLTDNDKGKLLTYLREHHSRKATSTITLTRKPAPESYEENSHGRAHVVQVKVRRIRPYAAVDELGDKLKKKQMFNGFLEEMVRERMSSNPQKQPIKLKMPERSTYKQQSDRTAKVEIESPDNVEIVDTPSIESHLHYDWPGKFRPFKHQIQTTEFLVQHHRAFCLSDMGSGKTASVLWAYDYLKKQQTVTRMLVVSPLSTLQRTWGDEIGGSFKHLRYMILVGSGDERRRKLREQADIYIINHDGLKIEGMVDAINRRQDIDIVVIDEISQAARTASTDRWKALAKVVRHELAQGGKRRVYGLTGTPTPNSPTDAWAQCRLITPQLVPPYFSTFESMVIHKTGFGRWEAKPDAPEIVARVMQPSIRFKRDECIDLPPVTYQTREVSLTAEQNRLYREMLVRLRAELDNGEITAVNELVKANKLLQIAAGAAYKTDGDTAYITPKERLEVTEEIIEEASGSIIVFVPFRGALDAVATYLAAKKLSVGVIHGGVSGKDRDQIFNAFQNDKTIRVLVAQPASMAHGLNLTAANTIIWFGPIYSNEIYQQSCARITRPGQLRNQLIVHIQGCPAERRVYARLREKEQVQGLLLELLRELRDD